MAMKVKNDPVLDRERTVSSPPPESVSVEVVAGKIAGEEDETERSSSSSEEMETSRSIWRWDGGAAARERVHSQVLRIRDEESCLLGEDKSANYRCNWEDRRYLHRNRLNMVLVSRPNLPCSPLGGKVATLKALQ